MCMLQPHLGGGNCGNAELQVSAGHLRQLSTPVAQLEGFS